MKVLRSSLIFSLSVLLAGWLTGSFIVGMNVMTSFIIAIITTLAAIFTYVLATIYAVKKRKILLPAISIFASTWWLVSFIIGIIIIMNK